VGLVTALGEAHLEYFGNLAGIAKAKGELYRNLTPRGLAVVNAQNPLLIEEAEAFKGQKIFFGFGPEVPLDPRNGSAGFPKKNHKLSDESVIISKIGRSDLLGQTVTFTGLGLAGRELTVDLKLPGAHNALNAGAAAATALALGLDWPVIESGLEMTEAFPGRLKIVKAQNDFYVVDDSYNSNPTSVAAALRFMSDLGAGRERAAILGDMLELGAASQLKHSLIGQLTTVSGISWLALVGSQVKYVAQGALEAGFDKKRIALFNSGVEAARWLAKRAAKNCVVLIKGSRRVGLESAASELLGSKAASRETSGK
jgi:UDP-N-acetylmuramyl pentapeptide synthase